MCRLNVSHLPSGLWQAGWGDAGERGTGPGAALLGSCLVGGLAERTAGILLLLATSRMHCSVTVSWLCCWLCLPFAEEEKPGMLRTMRSGPTPTAFCRAGWPGTRQEEEHLLLQRIASAIGLHTTFERLRVFVYTWS